MTGLCFVNGPEGRKIKKTLEDFTEFLKLLNQKLVNTVVKGTMHLNLKSCSLIVVKHLNIFLRLTNQMNSCCKSQQADFPNLQQWSNGRALLIHCGNGETHTPSQ